MPIVEIGCCGAYCKTCRAYSEKKCSGCKLGYDTGERDISKAKCKIKKCCMEKSFYTCADCPEYTACQTVQGFYGKTGGKYKKYQQATQYIRENGYDNFIAIADKWKNASGKY